MLSTTPEKLFELVRDAERQRDLKLEREQERIDRRLGAGYVKSTHNDGQSINHQHEWLSLMLPRLIFRAPKFKVQSARSGAQQETATAVRLFLNRWAKSIRLDRFLPPVAVDYSMTWGVVMTTPDRAVGSPDRRVNEDWIPRVTRIPPSRFIMDPHCDGPDSARFMGHVWVADADDLIERAKKDNAEAAPGGGKWDLAFLRGLKGKDTGTGSLTDRFKRRVPRNEIVGYDLWIPEIVTDGMGSEDGFHGTLLSVIEDDGGLTQIRKPRPFWGPAWGPYTLIGCYPANDDPWPLSPLAAVEPRELDLDTQYKAANAAAKQYKRVILAPKGSKIPEAFDGQVFYLDGLSPTVAPIQVEVGGVTDQQLKNIALMDSQLQRVSGMDAVQAGEVRGDGTATEVAIADSVTQTRAGFIIEQFAAGVERIAKSAAWYAVKDDRVRLSLGAEAAEALGIADPVFLGGEVAGENTPFEALELEIDPLSMTRSTEALQQRRTLEFFRIVAETAPLIMQAPMVNWPKLFGQIGDALNMPDAEEFIDFAMMQAPAMAGPQGGMGGGGMMPQGPQGALIGNETGAMAGAAMGVS